MIAQFAMESIRADCAPGLDSIVLLFVSGMQFLMLGAMGEHIANISDEVKASLHWVIRIEVGSDAMQVKLPRRSDHGGHSIAA